MKFKKLAAALSAAMFAATAVPFTASSAASAAVDTNYAEALQKSMFFYEVQQAGKLPEWNMVTWRADSMVNDVVPGGWFDAGDHIKFALTNAYTATVLAWGLIEYRDAVKNAGLYELYRNNLQWGLDYVAACDKGTKVVGTIADDAFDHVWWGSAEVYMRKFVLKGGSDPRPYDEITCTSTVAQMAAAMASGYLVFKEDDPTLAASYLKHAESLFKLADTTRDNTDQGVQGGGNYYKASDFFDDLFYAANWMYMATGDKSYLDKCESDYIPEYPLENQSTDRKFTWGFCWDDASQAAALLYAINTGKEEWIDQVYRHLEYWTTGYNGKRVGYTPDGMAWLFQWGSCRHVTTTCWLAKLACDTIFKDDAAKCDKYNKWVNEQYDYIFGNNDLGLCYVLGMGEKNPSSWHHRTSSGVWDDLWSDLGTEKEYAHVLYGALEGGPNENGTFTDKVNAYQNTEVAIDYNAGYTACLAALLADYGGKPLADFPPVETPKWDEFKMRASINQAGDSYTEIKAFALNHSAWPTRVIKDLSYNYYFDISELIEQGASASDIQVRVGYDQHAGEEGAVTISDPIQYDGNIYYCKITFGDGRVVMPTGQSEHRSECQFRIGISDSLKTADGSKVTWDSSNDYSFKGLAQGGETDMVDTKYITMYDGDKLIWGTEPDGTEAPAYTVPGNTTDTTENSGENTDGTPHYGDVDCNGWVELADAVLLCRAAAGVEGAELSVQGRANADVTGDNKIKNDDTIKLLLCLAGSIEEADLNPNK